MLHLRRLLLASFLLLIFAAGPANAREGRIALTFDDLPALTTRNDQAYVNDLNARLLAALRRHHAPAIGFVNEGKLDELDRAQQIDVLREWLRLGMNLGNHTFSHDSPNEVGAQKYIEDIARGEPVTKGLLAERHRRIRWFRHPYLETGTPIAVKREIDNWLHAHGYHIAPVTMEASDWMFAEPYDDALARNDVARQRAIRAQYLGYTEKMVGWYRSASRALFGREIAFVILLHATRLNADSIEDLLKILHANRLRPVTLDAALRDHAYRTNDPYAGKDGIEWLERWSLALHKDLPWDSFQDAPADIQADYNRVDAAAK